MRKIIISCILLLISIVAFAQKEDNNTKLNPYFVGTWKGNKSSKDKDNIDGFTKYWTTSLFKDGKGIISFFSFNDDGSIKQFAHNIEWWTEKNIFNIKFLTDNIIDSYKYTIKNDTIFYNSIQVYGESVSTNSFFETKILNHK